MSAYSERKHGGAGTASAFVNGDGFGFVPVSRGRSRVRVRDSVWKLCAGLLAAGSSVAVTALPRLLAMAARSATPAPRRMRTPVPWMPVAIGTAATTAALLRQLKILQVLPPRGSTSGGTDITLVGSGFILGFSDTGTNAKKTTTLKFGSNVVIDYTIIDDGTLEVANRRRGWPGLHTVSITNPQRTVRLHGLLHLLRRAVPHRGLTRRGPAARRQHRDPHRRGFHRRRRGAVRHANRAPP